MKRKNTNTLSTSKSSTSADNDGSASFKIDKENVSQLKILLISEISSARAKKSPVWKYFGHLIFTSSNGAKKRIGLEYLFCKPCLDHLQERFSSAGIDDDDIEFEFSETDDVFKSFTVKRYKETVSTNNFIRHLQDDHRICIDDKIIEQKTTTLKNFFKPKAEQKRLTQSMTKAEEKFILARQIALFICKDLLPFNVVSADGFLGFALSRGIITEKEDMPDRTTISRTALNDVYLCVLYELKKQIKNGPLHVCVTFDMWTDVCRKPYITYTLHQLTDDFDLQKFTLTVRSFPERHTGENILESMECVKEEFQLKDKVITAVTDAGRNVVKAINLANIPSHRCWGHALHNLIMRDGIAKIDLLKQLQAKVRRIITAIRYKSSLLVNLEQEQQNVVENVQILDEVLAIQEQAIYDEVFEIELDEEFDDDSADDLDNDANADADGKKKRRTLKLDCVTRWNSLLLMMESFGENKQTVLKIMQQVNCKEEFTVFEWKLLQEITKFLQDFKTITEIMSAENVPTLNLCLLFRSEIEDKLKADLKDSPTLLDFKLKMKQALPRRFPITELIVLGSLMDPNYFNLNAIDSYLSTLNLDKEAFLLKMLNDYGIEEKFKTGVQNAESTNCKEPIAGCSKDTEPTAESSNDKTSKKKYLEKIRLKHSTISSDSAASDEVSMYLSIKKSPDDVLSFWKRSKEQFPRLSMLAQCVLSISSTSTPSERVFSTTGLIIDRKRTLIEPINVGKVTVVHDNYNLLEKN